LVKATNWLNEAQLKEVEAAVVAAEKTTRCEFVCAVATRSAPYERAIRWWSLVGAVLGLWLAGTLDHVGHDPGDWTDLHEIRFVPALLGVTLGFLLMSALTQRVPPLLMMILNPRERQSSVERAATQLFGRHKVSHTEERVGLLLYVSLAERKFVVLADRAVHQVLGVEGIAALTALGAEQLSRGEKQQAFVKCLAEATNRLKDEFPFHEGDQNELQDQVLAIHPFP
jgi:putative membrane protein